MGLDMYAYSVPNNYAEYVELANTDDLTEKQTTALRENSTEIAYWRKHNRLHGWFANEYLQQKGIGADNFNCVNFIITLDMIERLSEAYFNNGYPKTEGFFFGNDSTGYYEDEDWAFICAAKRAIKKGNTVFYFAWW